MNNLISKFISDRLTVYFFSYFVYNKMFCVYIFEERVKFIVDLLEWIDIANTE